jgi:hypothetical protein
MGHRYGRLFWGLKLWKKIITELSIKWTDGKDDLKNLLNYHQELLTNIKNTNITKIKKEGRTKKNDRY